MDDARQHAQATLQQLRGAFEAQRTLRRAEWGAWAWGLFLLAVVAVIVIFAEDINPRKGFKALVAGIAALVGAILAFTRAATARSRRKTLEDELRALDLTTEQVAALMHVAEGGDPGADR